MCPHAQLEMNTAHSRDWLCFAWVMQVTFLFEIGMHKAEYNIACNVMSGVHSGLDTPGLCALVGIPLQTLEC
jgi:hypothetical protein